MMGGGGIGVGFSGGHSGGFVGGRVHHSAVGTGYAEDWMTSTKKVLEAELKERGLAPAAIETILTKIEEPSVAGPVWIAILATAFVLTVIFWIVWEMT